MSAISTEQFEAMQQDLPDWCPKEYQAYVRELFRAYTIHLTQPAQAVDGWQPTDDDVQAWRGRHNISLSLYDCRSAIEDARIMHHFDVRPAALPNANGKEGS